MTATVNDKQNYPVIIIGAGISGLTLAYRLQQQGVNALLIDQGNTVGGLIRTTRDNGYLIEGGPNGFLVRDHEDPIMRLLAELQLTDVLIDANPAQKNRFVFHNGKLNPVPMHPLALLRTPLIDITALPQALGELWRPRLQMTGASPAEQIAIDETLANFVRRRMGQRLGQQLVENLIDPMVTGIYAGNAEQLSAGSAFPKIKELEWQYGSLLRAMLAKIGKKTRPRLSLKSLRQGMSTLPERLVEKITPQLLRLQTSVEKVHFQDQQYHVTLRADGKASTCVTPTLVIAASAKGATKLIAGSNINNATQVAAALQKIPLAALFSISLGYAKNDIPTSLNGYGFLVTKKSHLHLLGSIWASSLFPERAPQGDALLTCMLGGVRNPELIDKSDDEIIRLLRADLQTTMGISVAPKVMRLHRWTAAIPQYNVGHQAIWQEIHKLLAATPGLHFTGNYIDGISVTHCVERAMQLADQLALEANRGTGHHHRRRPIRTDGSDLHGAR